MKRSLPLIVLLLLFTLPACVSLTPQAEEMHVTRSSEDVSSCENLGEVSASPPFVGPNDARNTLRNRAAEKGGDTLFITNMSVGTARGYSYKCAGIGQRAQHL